MNWLINWLNPINKKSKKMTYIENETEKDVDSAVEQLQETSEPVTETENTAQEQANQQGSATSQRWEVKEVKVAEHVIKPAQKQHIKTVLIGIGMGSCTISNSQRRRIKRR